ncbi:hypothetical protein AB0F20_08655 [Streptomyces goshikiensis]|uniref:hypothetical protein n=1 Tax=Streptomyces goshikiensis TaxID=1942 RepID=UPI003405C33E
MAGLCPGAGTGEDLLECVGEICFVLLGVAAVFDLGFEVLPQVIAEGLVDVVAMDPADLGQLPVGQAEPDLPGVVGGVVGFPFPAAGVDVGGLSAERVEDGVVVGAVADADPAVVDLVPAGGEQLNVVACGQRDTPACTRTWAMSAAHISFGDRTAWAMLQQASFSTSRPRWTTLEPVYPAPEATPVVWTL